MKKDNVVSQETPEVPEPEVKAPAKIPTSDRIFEDAASIASIMFVRPESIYGSVTVFDGIFPERQRSFACLLLWNSVVSGGMLFIQESLASVPPFEGKKQTKTKFDGWLAVYK